MGKTMTQLSSLVETKIGNLYDDEDYNICADSLIFDSTIHTFIEHQKTTSSLFSGSIEKEHWPEMGYAKLH